MVKLRLEIFSGRCLIPSQSAKKLDKKIIQVTSSKGTSPLVPNMELLYGNKCTTKPMKCCRKLVKTKNGGHNTISKNEWTEEQIIQFDELALEDHSYIATREERDRNEKSWVLKLNEEGDQGPMNQRFDFVEAKREMKRLHDEHVKETSEGNTPIHLVQRSRQRRHQQFEGLGESNYQVDAQTGWRGLFFEVTGKFEPVGKVEFLAILIFDRTVGFFLV